LRGAAERERTAMKNSGKISGATDFGARLVSPGRTRFRIWAPDCAAVALEIDGQDDLPMRRDDDGFFSAEASCGAGTRYRYRVAPDLAVPDPASRSQAGDIHDWSVVVDSNAYRWRHEDWRGRPWHEAVIYELHAGIYGGFRNIAADLSRIAAMGFTAIELMPIADFPGKHNWGYDGVLPYAPDAAYGTPDDLKTLVDIAHGLGLSVILDVVYNHFGPDGNYLAAYASSFFDPGRRTPWGDAIDFRQWQVRRFFIENALYWVQEFRFDGLRFDAAHAIDDVSFLEEIARDVRAGTKAGRHVHLILENENNDASLLRTHLFDAQWADDWHHCVHVLLTGEREAYYEDFQQPARQLARCMAEGFAYQGEASANAGGKPRGSRSVGLPGTSFIICLQNHDQIGNRAMGERLTLLANPEALRAAELLLLLTPQIPMIFMGQEWAETRPFLFFTDHNLELAETVRTGRRREFARFAAFSDVARREQIPDPNAAMTFAQSVPQWPPVHEPNGTLAFYREALRLRMTHITPHLPESTPLGAVALGDAAVQAAWRLSSGVVLTLAANFAAQALTFAPPEGHLLLHTGDSTQTDCLPAFSAGAWLQQT
jgi:maltooligosyltrehalose trehalohydrolase